MTRTTAAVGLIERIVDEADRRRLVVAITAEGRRRPVREMQRREIRLGQQLSRLTADERAILGAAPILIDRLGKIDENVLIRSPKKLGRREPSIAQ